MNIHEAIASGRRYTFMSIHWGYGPLMPCPVCFVREHTLKGTTESCSGFRVQSDSVLEGYIYLRLDSMSSNNWKVEPHEDDFESLAESLLNDIGINVKKTDTVEN